MKKIRNYIIYIFALVTVKFIGIWPRWMFFALAPLTARILFLVPQIGKISMMNLAVAFPEKSERERKEIAIASLRNLYLSIAEFFWSRARSSVTDKLVGYDAEADETVAAAHKFVEESKRGAIFVSPHIGNWEFAGMVLALHYKFDLGTVVRTPQNPYMDRIISGGRKVKGVQLIYSRGAAKAMLSRVRQGRSLGVLIDQNTRVSEGGQFVDFFGLPVPVSMVPAHLARREKLFVAVGGTFRIGKKFVSTIKQLPKKSGEYQSDEELTQDIMKITEDFVRMYPDQYLWMYRRFQNIPREADDGLKKKFPPYAKVAAGRFYDRKKHSK